uniref:Uncharacterized protein n=1 Tax=Opuntia streptacantha TaxID=393608 RepID=A0A7C9EYC9_OPUST
MLTRQTWQDPEAPLERLHYPSQATGQHRVNKGRVVQIGLAQMESAMQQMCRDFNRERNLGQLPEHALQHQEASVMIIFVALNFFLLEGRKKRRGYFVCSEKFSFS